MDIFNLYFYTSLYRFYNKLNHIIRNYTLLINYTTRTFSTLLVETTKRKKGKTNSSNTNSGRRKYIHTTAINLTTSITELNTCNKDYNNPEISSFYT